MLSAASAWRLTQQAVEKEALYVLAQLEGRIRAVADQGRAVLTHNGRLSIRAKELLCAAGYTTKKLDGNTSDSYQISWENATETEKNSSEELI